MAQRLKTQFKRHKNFVVTEDNGPTRTYQIVLTYRQTGHPCLDQIHLYDSTKSIQSSSHLIKYISYSMIHKAKKLCLGTHPLKHTNDVRLVVNKQEIPNG